MKVVQINIFPNLSTGSIMMNIHNYLLKNNVDSYVVWGRGRKENNNNEYYMDDKLGVYYHVLYTRLTDKTGFASKKSTKKLIKWLNEIKPDVIHLHNIHGYYINIELLFDYFKRNPNIKIIWTLHDCWPFTGHCAYFDSISCEKWMNECSNCPLLRSYPSSYTDNSKWNYNKKKLLFTSVKMNIVTPSKWLADLVNESYLKDNDVYVINNGINTSIFKNKKSDFKEKYGLINKKIILGVASTWDKRKGLDDFIELSKKLDDSYKIVLVGLSKKQVKEIPNNILGFERTKNVDELVDIYSSADIFFNPTREDNYPTVNLEAYACGTPVVTYKTGGSPESAINGYVVKNVQDFCDRINDFKYIESDSNNDYSIETMSSKYYQLYKK